MLDAASVINYFTEKYERLSQDRFYRHEGKNAFSLEGSDMYLEELRKSGKNISFKLEIVPPVTSRVTPQEIADIAQGNWAGLAATPPLSLQKNREEASALIQLAYQLGEKGFIYSGTIARIQDADDEKNTRLVAETLLWRVINPWTWYQRMSASRC